jgi:hypothetical protein
LCYDTKPAKQYQYDGGGLCQPLDRDDAIRSTLKLKRKPPIASHLPSCDTAAEQS